MCNKYIQFIGKIIALSAKFIPYSQLIYCLKGVKFQDLVCNVAPIHIKQAGNNHTVRFNDYQAILTFVTPEKQ